MNPLQTYRPGGISVTDMSAQLWCEKQLEFSLMFGRKKTKGMKRGNKIHKELHEEIVEVIEVEPKTFADYMALKLFNCLSGTEQIRSEGMTRELPVWGKVNSLFVSGMIDELNAGSGSVAILDTKTRTKPTMPSEAQKRTTRFQLMVYRHLLDSLKSGRFTHVDFMEHYMFTSTTVVSDEFRSQMADTGNRIEADVLSLAKRTFESMNMLPSVADDMEVRYEYQETRDIIGSDMFRFDHSDFAKTCDFVEEFWTGKRPARKVSENNKWKCSFCEFKGRCILKDNTLRDWF